MLKYGLTFLAFLGGLYGLLLLILWVGQERFIFQASSLPQGFAFTFPRPFEEIHLPAGKDTVHGLYFPARPGQKSRQVVLYLHGNAGTLEQWGDIQQPFTELGADILIIDYRGYGKSSGTPTEQKLYDDAEAAVAWLLERYEANQIVLYGRSLGSGVAAWLASRYAVQALVLETPYDELSNVIRAQVIVPLPDFIFRHRFPTHEYLPRRLCPAYILAGSRDRLIPLRLSRRLQPFLEEERHFIVIEGAGHHNLGAFPEYHFHLRRILLNS